MRRLRGGEAAPAKPGRRDKRMVLWSVWWRMRRDGLSFREIADAADKPPSTVHAGVKAYEVHLAAMPEGDRLEAMLGLYRSVGMAVPRWLRKLLKF